MYWRLRNVLCAGLLLVLAGCGVVAGVAMHSPPEPPPENLLPTRDVYHEPDLPADEMATLDLGKMESFSSMVLVRGIDGKAVSAMYWVKLAPGQHEIVATLKHEHTFVPDEHYHSRIVITVEAGHEYQIRASKDQDVVRIWVENTETEAVAGESMVSESGA